MTLPTRFAICTVPAHLGAVAAELVAAGWQHQPGLELGPDPWSRRGEGLLRSATDLASTDTELVLELLTRGVSVAVQVHADPTAAAGLFDQGRRLATAEWFDERHPPLTLGLDQVQLRLLTLVGGGADGRRAAEMTHLSERTAARRLAAARDTLGARSTAEAAARVTARAQALRAD